MSQHTLKISLGTATIISMNAMIGSGIFAAPAAMAAYVGPAGIVAYILVVISVWFTAISLARLAELYPQEGSFYIYAKQWGGHTVGVIAGLTYFIGLIMAMGLLAQVTGTYLHTIIPTISPTILGGCMLAALVMLNMYGVALSTLGQHILICTTLLPLVIITALCFSKANLHNLTPFAPYGVANIFKATRVVIFSFFGFECAASLFSIVENAKKNVPKALTYSIGIVGTIYTLFVASIILALPMSIFSDPRIPLSDTLHTIFPDYEWLLLLIHCAILSALIGTIHSMIWSCGALLISLLKKISPTITTQVPLFTTQAAGVALVGAGITITFLSFTNLDLFFSITAFCIETAFILSIITLLTLPNEWKSGRNIKTIIGLFTALSIVYFASEGIINELTKIIQH